MHVPNHAEVILAQSQVHRDLNGIRPRDAAFEPFKADQQRQQFGGEGLSSALHGIAMIPQPRNALTRFLQRNNGRFARNTEPVTNGRKPAAFKTVTTSRAAVWLVKTMQDELS